MGEKRRIVFLVRTSLRETHDWTNVKNVNNELKSAKKHEKSDHLLLALKSATKKCKKRLTS